jgi:hypothetical protein
MRANAFSAPGLSFELVETAEESNVHWHGKIRAESAEFFQSEIRDCVIPTSRGMGVDR